MSGLTKINVIIPTRERADTLYHSLKTVITQDYPNLVVIVSDNFSQDNTKEVVDSFDDPRIHYINTGRRLSMAHNWEFALSHVTDGWVMFIGDDDGLYPWALQLLDQHIQSGRVEAISSECGGFCWPEHFDDCMQGSLTVPIKKSALLKSSRRELRRVLSGSLPYSKLPWLYNGGAASIELINRCRDSNGDFFRSQIPDMYSAVALSFATENYLFIETPIAINGASKHSTGCSGMRSVIGKEVGPVLQFISEENIPFDDSLIQGKSLQVCVYENYLKSWHLHKGVLGVELEDQLRVAVEVAPYEQWPEVRKQCRVIADRNGLSFPDKKESLWGKIVRFYRYQREVVWKVSFDATSLGLKNVYDAALASACIHHCLANKFFGLRLLLSVYYFFMNIRFWTLLSVNFIMRAILSSRLDKKG